VPGPDGVTLNDSEGHSAPNNPNNFQDFPILTSAKTNKGGVTIISGSFSSPSQPNTSITVDFYADATPGHPFTDPATGITNYYGEGQIYLGSQTYMTNPQGTFRIGAFQPSVTVPVGYYVTATATDPAGNTSEFGPDVLTTSPGRASQTVTVNDTSNGSVTGTSGAVPVNPAKAAHFAISAPASVSRGTAFSFTVTALDDYGNVATDYTGTVHFTSSDGRAVLPVDYTFQASDAGVATFQAILDTPGVQSLTATDTKHRSITGQDASIQVS
jgi:hypothetical protein